MSDSPTPLQFAAQAYKARAPQSLDLVCINAFVETAPKEATSQVPVYCTPGLSIFAQCGNGPINGLWVMGSLLYILSGSTLFSANSFGSVTEIGATDLGGLVMFADNGQQLVGVDGSGGWIYQPGGLNQVTTATISPAFAITITVGGTVTATDVLTLKATSISLSGGSSSVSYTVQGGDTTTTIAAALAAAVNASTTLPAAGFVATSAAAVITVTWPQALTVSWSTLVSLGATETLTAGGTAPANATSVAANITGTITMGDTLNIPLDSGITFTTTASQTVTSADTTIFFTDPVPSQVTAGAAIIDPANVLAQITSQAFLPPNTVVYMDGYFVFAAAGTRQFFLSAINDGTQYSGLDFATATANTGFVVAVANFHEQLLVLTSKPSTEVWYDSGAVAFPFVRYDGAYIQRGLASRLGWCQEDNTFLWMGDDGNFYRLNGFNPQRISKFAQETAWANYPLKFTDCVCFVLNQEGHKFVVCQFPSGQQTWVYDIAEDLWHERRSYGTQWVAS